MPIKSIFLPTITAALLFCAGCVQNVPTDNIGPDLDQRTMNQLASEVRTFAAVYGWEYRGSPLRLRGEPKPCALSPVGPDGAKTGTPDLGECGELVTTVFRDGEDTDFVFRYILKEDGGVEVYRDENSLGLPMRSRATRTRGTRPPDDPDFD